MSIIRDLLREYLTKELESALAEDNGDEERIPAPEARDVPAQCNEELVGDVIDLLSENEQLYKTAQNYRKQLRARSVALHQADSMKREDSLRIRKKLGL